MEDVYYNPSDPGGFGGIQNRKKDTGKKERRQEMVHFSRHVHLTQTCSQIVPKKTRSSPWNI